MSKDDRQRKPIFSTPVYYGGRVYAMEESGGLWVLDADTGKVLSFGNPLPEGKRRPAAIVWSPLSIGGAHLYALGQGGDGAVLVFELGDDPRFVFRGSLESMESTPWFDGKRIYVHTKSTLYCIAPSVGVKPEVQTPASSESD